MKRAQKTMKKINDRAGRPRLQNTPCSFYKGQLKLMDSLCENYGTRA